MSTIPQKKRGRPKKIITAEEKELLEQHKYEVKLKCNRAYVKRHKEMIYEKKNEYSKKVFINNKKFYDLLEFIKQNFPENLVKNIPENLLN
jgi:hypothetical protein